MLYYIYLFQVECIFTFLKIPNCCTIAKLPKFENLLLSDDICRVFEGGAACWIKAWQQKMAFNNRWLLWSCQS